MITYNKIASIISGILCAAVLSSPVSFATELTETDFYSSETEALDSCLEDNSLSDGNRVLHDAYYSDSTVLFTGSNDAVQLAETGGFTITEELLDYFREQTESFSSTIDLSKFKIPSNEFEDVYKTLVLSSPKSYYLMNDSGSIPYYDPLVTNGYVKLIFPAYQLDIFDDYGEEIVPEKLAAVMPDIEDTWQLIDNEVNKVFWYVSTSMTDAEKLIQFHNYVNFNFKYAYDEYAKPVEERTGNSLVYLLKNRTGMCQAYAMFMNYLAMQAGLNTAFVTSFDQYGNPYHMWNLIEAKAYATDNEPCWYHIDSTWDDTLNDGYGVTNMKYFLLSDKKVRESHDNITLDNYYVTYGDIGVDTGNRFDDALWHDSASPLVPFAYKWYFIKHLSGETEPSKLYEFDPLAPEGSQYTELYSYKERWYADPEGVTAFNNTYTGLGCINGKLYFNGPKTLYSYNLHSRELKEKVPIETAKGYAVYSCYVDGTRLHYGIAKSGPDAYKNIFEGDTIKLTNFAISESRIADGILHVRFATDSSGDNPHDITFIVKDGDEFKAWNGTVTNKQHIEIPISDPDNIELYFWNKKMQPYTDFYYLEGVYHEYD